MTLKSQIVPVGELLVSADRDSMLFTVTGSCVALTLYDTANRVGGMVHVVLPRSWHAPDDRHPDGYFADRGVPLLFKEMAARGSVHRHLKSVITGGAALGPDNGTADIGRRNISAVTRLLARYGIPASQRGVGGRTGQRVQLEIATGQVIVEPVASLPVAGDHRIHSDRGAKAMLTDLGRVGANPVFSNRLLKTVHQPVVDWHQVKEIISRDAALILHVFRFANSPYYGRPGQIASFEMALSFLGPRRYRRICMMAAVIRPAEPPFDTAAHALLSRHCLSTAVIAGLLAEKTGHPAVAREAFTAGLLHGAGSLALLLMPATALRAGSLSGLPESDPHELSARILSGWQIPHAIVDAVRHMGDPQRLSLLGKFLYMGCGISRKMGLVPLGEASDPAETTGFSEALGNNMAWPEIIPDIKEVLKSKGLMDYLDLTEPDLNRV